MKDRERASKTVGQKQIEFSSSSNLYVWVLYIFREGEPKTRNPHSCCLNLPIKVRKQMIEEAMQKLKQEQQKFSRPRLWRMVVGLLFHLPHHIILIIEQRLDYNDIWMGNCISNFHTSIGQFLFIPYTDWFHSFSFICLFAHLFCCLYGQKHYIRITEGLVLPTAI